MNFHVPVTRRELIAKGCLYGLGGCLGFELLKNLTPPAFAGEVIPSGWREADFYTKIGNENMVHCTLCPCSPIKKNCGFLKDGEICVCRVRVNKGGTLYVTNYAKPSALHLDPLEKNPVFHMTPGKRALALATAGCNMACKCCQNWEMSQFGVEQIKSFDLEPSDVVREALKNSCSAISYTYTEPAIFYEYMIDTAKAARAKGLKNCMVSGGYINPEPMRKLCKYIDTFSISLKGYDEDYYKEYCHGSLKIIKNAMKVVKDEGRWLEIAILVIPTLSGNIDEIRETCRWIRDELGYEVPVHFLRFWPMYRLKNLPQTPVSTLESARKAATDLGLQYVYIGNLPGHQGNNTYCHSCKRLIVQRVGMRVIKNEIIKGRCRYCYTSIPGVWS